MVRKSTTKGGRTGTRAASSRRKAGPGEASAADETTRAKLSGTDPSDAQDTRTGGTETAPGTHEPSGDKTQLQDGASETLPTTDTDLEPASEKAEATDQMNVRGSGSKDSGTDAEAGQPVSPTPAQSGPIIGSGADTGSATEAADRVSDEKPAKTETMTAPDEVVKTGPAAEGRTDGSEKGVPPSDDRAANVAATDDGRDLPADGKDSTRQPGAEARVAAAVPASGAGSATSAPASITPPSSGAAPAKSGRGFFPLLLGGIVAGGIGFGAHYVLTQDQQTDEAAAELAADLAALRAEIAALPPAPDLAPLEAEIADLRDAAATRSGMSEIETELDQLRAALASDDGPDLGPVEERIEELVNQRAEMMIAQDSALDSLRATLAEAEAAITALRAEVDDLRDLAERRVVEAEIAVDTALARGALDSLRAALSTGAPYPDAVSQLAEAGVSVPSELARSAVSGVPTLEMLQERFPDEARAALRDTLQSAPADTTRERLGNFFRAQVGARSTAPRDGDDPDAILSRAGAFVEAGALRPALDELESLPETAQSSMNSWITGAQARLDAEAALPMLTDTITTE